ncbi:MAG: LysM peptidoglycan-binding domain-containing protein [Caldilineales bacterium]|nr:LysM peptidoglycan-binding domain-containing protein [Caldilineales bacterium]
MRRFVLSIVLSAALALTGLMAVAAPAAAASGSAPAAQAGGVHIVRAGETLSRIAARYGISVQALARANGIANPNHIYVGQRLVIPGARGAGSGAGGSGSAGGAARGVHVVRAGETLSSIAARYGVSASALARANGISNPNRIYVGQRLRIPAGGAASGGPAVGQPAPAPVSTGHWIDIDLSAQRLTAYEGSTPVFSTLISSGRNPTPTPVGLFRVGYKVRSQRMTGPGYDLPNVPWVMYFTNRGHAIHGAYWHNNFGYPMSHGCVNVPVSNAQWLYNFAPVGTPVRVRY